LDNFGITEPSLVFNAEECIFGPGVTDGIKEKFFQALQRKRGEKEHEIQGKDEDISLIEIYNSFMSTDALSVLRKAPKNKSITKQANYIQDYIQ